MSGWLARWGCVVVVWCGLGLVWPLPLRAQLAAEVTLLDGTVRSGELTLVSESQGIEWGDGQRTDLDAVREMRLKAALLGDDPSVVPIYLTGRGLLMAREIELADGQLRVNTDLGEVQMPLVDVRGIRLSRESGQAEWEQLLAEPSKEEDRLLVTTSRGPRVVSGLLEGFDAEGASLLFEDQVRRVGRDKILAVVPAALGGDVKPRYYVHLIDRSIAIADRLSLSEGQWVLGWKQSQTEFPAEMVNMISVQSDRVLYLSDLEPLSSEVQAMVGPALPSQRDLAVTGSPLTLRIPADSIGPGKDGGVALGGGREAVGDVKTFRRGCGMRARSRLEFEVPAGYAQLLGWVGVDQSTRGRGICDVRVLADGITVFSGQVAGNTSALPINLDLNGARRLELLVEPGPQLDLSDWVDWADSRLLK